MIAMTSQITSLAIVYSTVYSGADQRKIKHGINSFVYQGGKQWNALPVDTKDIKCLNVFKKYIDKWTDPDYHCGYCVLCAIKNGFYNNFTAGRYFTCFMQNIYDDILIHAYYAYRLNSCFISSVMSSQCILLIKCFIIFTTGLYICIPFLSCVVFYISFTINVSSSCRQMAHVANVYCL